MHQIVEISPFAILECLLTNVQKENEKYMHIVVYHLCHLLLRLLLLPESNENFKVFARLHTYQTSRLIMHCHEMLEFEQWLNYIKALDYSTDQKIKTLIELIGATLDLSKPSDFFKAESAVRSLIYMDYQGTEIAQANHKDLHYLLPKL